MKHLLLICLLLALTQCTDLDDMPISPEYARAHPEVLLMTKQEQVNQTAYNQGVSLGMYDVQGRRNADYTRYATHFTRETEAAFCDGYRAGYQNTQNGQFHPMLGQPWNGTDAR